MSDISSWPDDVEKPPLPEGYEWVCLRQALGLKLPDGTHPWWIRAQWVMKNGRKRHVPMADLYYATPELAIAAALETVRQHSGPKGR